MLDGRLFKYPSIFIAVTLFALSIVIAQQEETDIVIFADEDSLTVFIDGNQTVSLIGLSFEVNLDGRRQQRFLSDYQQLDELRFDSIPTPICLRLQRVNPREPVPSVCPRDRIFIQQISAGEVFWWDNFERQTRTLNIMQNEQLLEACPGGFARCDVTYTIVGQPPENSSTNNHILSVISEDNIESLESSRILQSHRSTISDISFSPNSRFLASGDIDGNVIVWDINTGENIVEFSTRSVESVSFNVDGTQLAVGTADGLSLWNPLTGERIRHIAPSLYMHDVDFNPEGNVLAFGDCRGVTVWDITSDRELALQEVEDCVLDIEFTSDGRYIFYGDSSGGLYKLDFRLNEVVANYSNATGWQMSYNSLENILLVTDGYTQAELLNGSNLSWLDSVWNGERVFAVDFHPNGNFFATGGNTVRIWSNSGNQLVNLYPDRDGITVDLEEDDDIGVAFDLEFSPDGTMLAVSGLHDPAITIWTVSE